MAKKAINMNPDKWRALAGEVPKTEIWNKNEPVPVFLNAFKSWEKDGRADYLCLAEQERTPIEGYITIPQAA